MVAIFIIAVVALLAVGLAVWQPWATPVVAPGNTTIIKEAPAKPNTTVVNPPPVIVNPPTQSEPAKTDIRINTDPPATTPTTGGD